jgi:Bacterial Ig domain
MSSIPLRWTQPHFVALFLAFVLTACGSGNSSAPPEITLTVGSSDVTVIQGQQSSLDLNVARVNGAVPVQLVAEGLPSGVSLVFTKNPVEDKTTATLKVGVNVTPATYPFQVVGTAGSVRRAIDLHLNVVRSADVTPPSVRLTVTPPGVTTSQTITLAADVQDDRGVARVEFFQNGVSLGRLTKAPWTTTTDITSEDNGAPLFSARATDTSGNTADSEPVMISVLIDKSDPVVTTRS